jgi:tetratricopeptide (TPR) repeat protein
MWIERVKLRLMRHSLALFLVAGMVATALAEEGQYRSKLIIKPKDAPGTAGGLSIEELEKQIDSLGEPYARSSAERHLARHYVEQKQYDKAIAYYRGALAAGGLSDIADREMQRELAQVYLLTENYGEAATTLERVLRSKLVPEAGDFLLLAQARYHLGNYVAVVAALDLLQEKGLALDVAQTRKALALYYRAGAFEQSERLLRQLLRLEPDNPQNWHQLASVYLQQNKKRQALDHLALAREKGVGFNERELLLLADLYAVNGNPYRAAQTLAEGLSAGTVTAGGRHYRRLFEFWLQAREQEKALDALSQAARLTGETELYLYLAQLQMERQAWRPMQQAVLAACSARLEDRYVGRANLLLGVSQLKLGDRPGARRSFINATLVGGVSPQAGQWLNLMEAAPPTEREGKRVVGPCYGSEGRYASLETAAAVEVAVAAPAGTPPVPDAGGFGFKTVPAQNLFYVEYDIPLAQLAADLRARAARLGVSLIKSGGSVDGPLQVIALGDAGVEPESGEVVLQVALPARGAPRAGGQFRLRHSEPFRCAYRVYEGPPEGLAQSWRAFARELRDTGHALSGEQRLLFPTAPASGNVRIEMQLGVEG